MRRCPRLVELNNAVTELPLPVRHRLDDLELICNIGEQWGVRQIRRDRKL
jgi:hypothetical protein